MRDGLYIDSDGNRKWFLNGKLHREDGPAIERANSTRYWYLNGKLHREDGPAIELANGTRQWYLNDQLHREDGPAIEWVDGHREWFLNGYGYSFSNYIEVRFPEDCSAKTLFVLKWSQ